MMTTTDLIKRDDHVRELCRNVDLEFDDHSDYLEHPASDAFDLLLSALLLGYAQCFLNAVTIFTRTYGGYETDTLLHHLNYVADFAQYDARDTEVLAYFYDIRLGEIGRGVSDERLTDLNNVNPADYAKCVAVRVYAGRRRQFASYGNPRRF